MVITCFERRSGLSHDAESAGLLIDADIQEIIGNRERLGLRVDSKASSPP